jgi:hypothetical protein
MVGGDFDSYMLPVGRLKIIDDLEAELFDAPESPAQPVSNGGLASHDRRGIMWVNQDGILGEMLKNRFQVFGLHSRKCLLG